MFRVCLATTIIVTLLGLEGCIVPIKTSIEAKPARDNALPTLDETDTTGTDRRPILSITPYRFIYPGANPGFELGLVEEQVNLKLLKEIKRQQIFSKIISSEIGRLATYDYLMNVQVNQNYDSNFFRKAAFLFVNFLSLTTLNYQLPLRLDLESGVTLTISDKDGTKVGDFTGNWQGYATYDYLTNVWRYEDRRKEFQNFEIEVTTRAIEVALEKLARRFRIENTQTDNPTETIKQNTDPLPLEGLDD